MQHNPDFATLSEAAYEAADKLIDHIDGCGLCGQETHHTCPTGERLGDDYTTKKSAALKALPKSKPLRGSSAKGGR